MKMYQNLNVVVVFSGVCTQNFKLTIIASTEPGKPYTQRILDWSEGDLQKRLISMEYNGGRNIRDKSKRKRKYDIQIKQVQDIISTIVLLIAIKLYYGPWVLKIKSTLFLH